jgi:hypothetical protein
MADPGCATSCPTVSRLIRDLATSRGVSIDAQRLASLGPADADYRCLVCGREHTTERAADRCCPDPDQG